MALTEVQYLELDDRQQQEYNQLSDEGKDQYAYFYGFTEVKGEEREVANQEVVLYQQASDSITLKSVAQLVSFIPHEGQKGVFFTFDAQHDLINNLVMVLGRRTGKSTVTSIIVLRELLLPFSSTILLTPTFSNANIMFNAVLKLVQQLNLPIKRINKGAFKLELENGATFSANSAANIESALGSSNSLLVVDEAQSIPNLENIMNQMLVPTTLDYGVRASGILYARQIIIGTPRGTENNLYDYFCKQDDANNWKSFSAPSHTNPTLPTSYIDKMKMELGEVLFRQEIVAEFIGAEDNVFYAFDREVNLYDPDEVQFSPDSLAIVGLDVGYRDSTAMVLIYREVDTYYVHAAYCEAMLPTETHLSNFRAIEYSAQGEVDMRYIDPSAAQAREDFITTHDYVCHPAKNAVLPSLQYINQLLAPSGANQKPKLYISSELDELIRQVARVRYKDQASKRSQDPFIRDPKGTHWDLIAALRYALYSDQFNQASLNII